MKANIALVTPDSNYYIYTPSKLAQDIFFYPLQCGLFTYLPGYELKRESFDSFLLMYIQKGELTVETGQRTYHALTNQFVLLDCYQYHAYSSATGCECLWCHFDGITARSLYENIVNRLEHVFTIPDSYPIVSKLNSIYQTFFHGSVVREPLLSKYLNDILTAFLLYQPAVPNSINYGTVAEEVITYITEHFAEDITVEQLASNTGLSLFHFIRTFRKETGFTPHEYILNTRIATAQYLLRNTDLLIKDICFTVGFSSENVFCSAFKRRLGMTPSQYRNRE